MSTTRPRVASLTSEEEQFMRALGRLVLVLPRLIDADLMREQGHVTQ